MGLVLLQLLAVIGVMIVAAGVLNLDEADRPRLVDVVLEPLQRFIEQVGPILDFSSVVFIFVLFLLDLVKYLAHHLVLGRMIA